MSTSASSSTSSQTSSGVDIAPDGTITVSAGATVSGLTVSAVTEFLYGTGSDTDVVGFKMPPYYPVFDSTPGVEVVESGGVSIDSNISAQVYFLNNNYAEVEESPASQTIMSGGTSIGAQIEGAHLEYSMNNNFGDGSALMTESAVQIVESGGQAVSARILDNGLSDVLSGGSARDTTLSGSTNIHFAASFDGNWHWIYTDLDAVQIVESGASVTGTDVEGSGLSEIMSGGSASDTVLQGGTMSYYEDGPNTPVRWVYRPTLATQTVQGTSEDIQVNSNGLLLVDGTVTNAQITSGGTVVASSGATLEDISVSSGGVLELASNVTLNDPVKVQTGAAFIFDDISASGGTFSGTVTPDGSGTGHLEILSGGIVLKEIEVEGDFTSPIDFMTAASGNHLEMGFGTPCYCPGTLIATPKGERPVETLEIGDLVLTASGERRPIRWIGRRAYDPLFAHGNRDVLPILIRRDALAPGLPKRDLTISPLHAMFLDGVLVPALHLVNGRTITQLTRMTDPIRYIHIELETHDLLLAEGAASESFLDDGSRGMFHNADEYANRYPADADRPVRYCAPRIESGPKLAKIRAALDIRAHSLTPHPFDALGPRRMA